MKSIARFVSISSLVLVLSGCGGGGEDFTDRPRIRVHWPALGRSLEPSPYVNSLRITFVNARPDADSTGSRDVIIRANRPSDIESEVVYASPEPINPGKVFVSIVAFSQANMQGRQLQAFDASLTRDSDGFLPNFELQPGAGITKKVAITNSFSFGFDPNSEYRVGQEQQLHLMINDNNSLFFSNPLFESEVHWTVSASENPDGPVVTGMPKKGSQGYYSIATLRPGTVTLIASVDGVASVPVQFRVVP